MRTAQSRATLATNRIDLINKNDTGVIAFSLVKEVAHAAGTNSNEHLHKLGTTYTKEWHASLTRHST